MSSPTLAEPAVKAPMAIRNRATDKAKQPGGVAGMPDRAVGGLMRGNMSASFENAPPPPPPPAPVMDAKQASPRAGGGGAQRDAVPRTAATLTPMIARTATLNLTVDNIDRERVVVEGLLAHYGGFAAHMYVNRTEFSPRSLSASLRVPATELVQALADLRTLGHVESESQSGEDVGQDHADLQARLNNARSTEDRLRGILREHTGSVSDVLEVEEQIASTRESIESMEAELDGMEHRVRYATVELQLNETSAKPARTFPGRLGQSLATGWNNAEEMVVSLLLWLAEEGPAIAVVLLLLGTPAVWLWRRYGRTHP